MTTFLKLFLVSCSILPFYCYAETRQIYLDELIAHAHQQQLHQHPQWLKLLHYRPAGLTQQLRSQADDDNFFLARHGKTDPASELAATLAAFFTRTTASSNDDHAQCRFPARFYWLQNQLNFDKTQIPAPKCIKYNKWRNQFNGHSVALVFPSAYLNSPSSMYGHTFIRIDPKDRNHNTQLLSYTVNYAADSATNENQFVLAYKGLFGGYRGITNLLPYHMKVKQYSDMESRDIWEYQLNFSPEETTQLIRHVWEIESINFDYFYLDENCAYRVIALLEVARPELDILSHYSSHAIPVDTIRSMVAENTLVNVVFRPSLATQLRSYINQTNPTALVQAEKIINGDSAPSLLLQSTLPKVEKASILELAYESLRYKKQSEELDPGIVKERSFPILLARSQLKQKSSLHPPETPEVRPDQGHKSGRVQIQTGSHDSLNYLSIEWRPSFHEWLDPPAGFIEGGQIEFLKTKIRHYEGGTSKLDSLKIINIASISPRDTFFSPLSWEVSTGLRRVFVNNQDLLAAYFTAGAGYSYALFNGIFYGLLNSEIQLNGDFNKSHSVGPGIHSGWLSYNHFGQTMLELKYKDYLLGEQYQAGEASLAHTFNLAQNQSFSFRVAREKLDDDMRSDISLAFNYYY